MGVVVKDDVVVVSLGVDVVVDVVVVDGGAVVDGVVVDVAVVDVVIVDGVVLNKVVVDGVVVDKVCNLAVVIVVDGTTVNYTSCKFDIF